MIIHVPNNHRINISVQLRMFMVLVAFLFLAKYSLKLREFELVMLELIPNCYLDIYFSRFAYLCLYKCPSVISAVDDTEAESLFVSSSHLCLVIWEIPVSTVVCVCMCVLICLCFQGMHCRSTGQCVQEHWSRDR